MLVISCDKDDIEGIELKIKKIVTIKFLDMDDLNNVDSIAYHFEYDEDERLINLQVNERTFNLNWKNSKVLDSIVYCTEDLFCSTYYFKYDELNRISEIMYGNRLLIKYYYNGSKQITEEFPMHRPKVDYEYHFNNNGNITSIVNKQDDSISDPYWTYYSHDTYSNPFKGFDFLNISNLHWILDGNSSIYYNKNNIIQINAHTENPIYPHKLYFYKYNKWGYPSEIQKANGDSSVYEKINIEYY